MQTATLVYLMQGAHTYENTGCFSTHEIFIKNHLYECIWWKKPELILALAHTHTHSHSHALSFASWVSFALSFTLLLHPPWFALRNDT